MKLPHRSLHSLRRAGLLAIATWLAGCSTPAPAGPDVTRTPANQDERMTWWREARFGMFLHWGLYAIPAGKWGEQTGYGEWIRDSARIPRETYDDFRPHWNPSAFDADAWAQMAADAGMKYVVITSKHHDGFCLWNSAETDWDIGSTPNRRDVLGELAAACRRRGIAFGTYHSIMDWHHPDYLPRRPWETNRSTQGADFDRFERHLHAQVGELIARYQPAVMWFDGEWESTWNHERGLRLYELCRRLAPGMLVNNRVDVHRGGMGGFSNASEAVGDFATPEQEIPATGLPGVDWESCMTMNSHWGWNAADTHWKSASELVRNLIDIASKGGNYLLNIGPRADGTFPPAAVQRLAENGTLKRTHGEAIHGTTASVFDALPWGRCTVRRAGDVTRLYLHVFDWPADGQLVVPGLGSDVQRAFVLGAPDASLAVARGDGTLAVTLPKAAPDTIASVVVLEVKGEPVVFRAPSVQADTDEFVRGVDVVIQPGGAALTARYTLDGSDVTEASPAATAPLHLEAGCTVRTASFWQGQRVSPVVARTFTQVTPRPAAEAAPNKPGLVVEHFDVDWQAIPEQRAGMKPRARETVMSVGPLTKPGEKVAFVYRGFLKVPQDELYRFALTSDDGSKLWIDGDIVVDNDGLHGAVEKRGAAALAKGWHRIEVVWFNATGGASLELKWALPGQAFVALGEADLAH